MPMYEFQCNSCKSIKEELCSMNTEVASEACLSCLEPMRRITSAVHGLVSGTKTPVKMSKARTKE